MLHGGDLELAPEVAVPSALARLRAENEQLKQEFQKVRVRMSARF